MRLIDADELEKYFINKYVDGEQLAKDIRDTSVVKAIPIFNKMINGDVIEALFPNVEISPNPYSPSVDIYVGGIMMMRVDRNWYNALYKEDKE